MVKEYIMDNYSLLASMRIERLLGKEPAWETPADIIADIVHWCDSKDLDFNQFLYKALGYYEDEVDEEKLLEDDGA
jgi:hypothetical protein